MFHNSALNEMASKHIMADRIREAEQYRLLKRAEAARRPQPGKSNGFLGVIRQTLARRTFSKPTAAAG